MTLKEKFNTMVLDKDIADWEQECEKIADDYAIEFAIWLVERVAGEKGLVLQEGVLERFKKEKGL